jgi:hypothetical protein
VRPTTFLLRTDRIEKENSLKGVTWYDSCGRNMDGMVNIEHRRNGGRVSNLFHRVKILFCLLLVTGAASPCFAYTANDANKTISTDGTVTDTQAAVNYVAAKAQDGWVMAVGVAGGAYTWASALTINIPHIFTIQGASPSNRPTITSTASGGFGIALNVTDQQLTTVKDLKFNGWSATNALFVVAGNGLDTFRFTNIEFTGTHTWCIWVSSPGGGGGKGPYGLIDHCSLPSSGSFFYIRDNPLASPNSWHRPMTWGTREAVYIEDCTLVGTSPTNSIAMDGDNGCRVVFRHNNVTNFQADLHGADTAGPINSCLQLEFMHNTFTMTNNVGDDAMFYMRGGSGVFFDNTLNRTGNGWYNFMIKMVYQRADGQNPFVTVDRIYPADYIGTMQPGCGVVAVPGQDPRHPSEPWGSVPAYIWNNHINAPISFQPVGVTTPFMQLNRDYFYSSDSSAAKPGYTEYTYPHPLGGVASPKNLHTTGP